MRTDRQLIVRVTHDSNSTHWLLISPRVSTVIGVDIVSIMLVMPPPLIGGALSDAFV